jgi:type IV pilus assembly protein PilW
MKSTSCQSTARRHGGRAQRGLTLVELLVSITISLIVVLAATLVYQTTRETQRTLDEAAAAHEAGAFALKAIGRDLSNAGFYPLVRTETNAENVIGAYLNITGQAAYDAGLFGCNGVNFDPVAGTCSGTAAPNNTDAVVVGYFTTDAFGTNVGHRADCEGNDVAGAAVNATRVGSGGAGVPPLRPLFVANRYQLSAPQNTTLNGRTVTVRSLTCSGNGANGTTSTSLVAGIDDLQITYGAFVDPDNPIPARFYTAAEIAGLGGFTTANGAARGPWWRVSAVRVCVIGRTFQTNAAIAPGAAPLTYTDCAGGTVNQDASDRSLRKTYVQVFSVRNRNTMTY